jgi:hypothetical protein
VTRENTGTVYQSHFAFQKLSTYIMEVANKAYVNTIDGGNILPYHTLFISIDDVQDAVEDMKMEHESTLAKTFKAQTGKMWCFLEKLSDAKLSNENYYFHFLFFKQILEEINGQIQQFVCNDECLGMLLKCGSKSFENKSLLHDWRQPFIETITHAIRAMTWMDQQDHLNGEINEAFKQSIRNILYFTLKYIDP